MSARSFPPASMATAILAATGACQQMGPPPPALLATLDEGVVSAERRIAERRIAECRVDAPQFSGDFRAVVVQAPAPTRVRLQLIPDFGGKVLDLIAGADAVHADWPYAGGGDGEAPPAALSEAIGISLLEAAAPLASRRVLGARIHEAGWLLEVLPVFDDAELTVHALVDAGGRVLERRYRRGRMRWREDLRAQPRFAAPEFTWTLSDVRHTALEDPPDSLFKR